MRSPARALVHRALRAATPLGVAVGLVVLGAISVGAVSAGGYSPSRQGCSPTADRNDSTAAQPGCHNAVLLVGGGRDGWHLVTVSTDQTASGQAVHSGSVTVDPGGGRMVVIVWDAHRGVRVAMVHSAGRLDLHALLDQSIYFGADDNLDLGEHDSANPDGHGGLDRPVANGPSDGGAVQVNTHPRGSLREPSSLLGNIDAGDSHDPMRAADATGGGCADGVCFGADTMRRTYYHGGCTDCPPQPIYADQTTTAWRSPDCNSGDTASQDRCGSGWRSGNEQGGIRQPYDERGAYVSDPGVFVYEDPDPQASPALPVYPLCEVYVGTQGVWICSKSTVPTTPAAAAATPLFPAPPRTTAPTLLAAPPKLP